MARICAIDRRSASPNGGVSSRELEETRRFPSCFSWKKKRKKKKLGGASPRERIARAFPRDEQIDPGKFYSRGEPKASPRRPSGETCVCDLPVMLSHSIRDVMILPYGLKRFSRSCCAMFFGKPLTYRFAPLIASLLGLA